MTTLTAKQYDILHRAEKRESGILRGASSRSERIVIAALVRRGFLAYSTGHDVRLTTAGRGVLLDVSFGAAEVRA